MNEIYKNNSNDLKGKFDYKIQENHKNIIDSRLKPKKSVPASYDNKNSKLSLSKSYSPEKIIEEFNLMNYVDAYYISS